MSVCRTVTECSIVTETVDNAMTEGRGLLTEREREALAGEDSDSYKYKTRTYFRRRLEKVESDIELLDEHDPELLNELRRVVCERELDAE